MTADSIVVNILERDFMEHLADSAIYICFHGQLCNFCFIYREGRSISFFWWKCQKNTRPMYDCDGIPVLSASMKDCKLICQDNFLIPRMYNFVNCSKDVSFRQLLRNPFQI